MLPDHVSDNSPPEVKHQIFRAFKEALNNVVTHSQAREVQINIVVGSDFCSITVRDDGVGIERFSLDAERRIGGRCDVESGPGKGTAIRLGWSRS